MRRRRKCRGARLRPLQWSQNGADRKRERLHGELRRRGCRHSGDCGRPWQKAALCGSYPIPWGRRQGPATTPNNDGTAIDANSWQRLDEVPMTSTTDYVRQQANSGTATSSSACRRRPRPASVMSQQFWPIMPRQLPPTTARRASSTERRRRHLRRRHEPDWASVQERRRHAGGRVLESDGRERSSCPRRLLDRLEPKIHSGTRSCSKPRSTDSSFTMAQASPQGGRRLLLLVSDDEPESKQHGAPEPDRTGHEQDDPAPFNSLASPPTPTDRSRDRNRDAEWKNDQRPPLVPAGQSPPCAASSTIRTRTRPEPRAPRPTTPGRRRLTLATLRWSSKPYKERAAAADQVWPFV